MNSAAAPLQPSEFESSPAAHFLTAYPVPAFVLDFEDARILAANEEFLALTGYTRSDLVGRTPLEARLWLDAADFQTCAATFARDGRVRDWKLSFRTAAGETKQALHSGGLAEVAGKRCIIATWTDISALARCEQQLEVAEDRFRLVFQNSNLAKAIQTLDDCRFVEVNRRFVELAGLSEKDLVAQRPDVLGIWAGPASFAEFLERVHRQGSVEGWETEFRTANLPPRQVLLSGVVAEFHGRKYLYTTSQDITDRKAAEQRLRESEKKFRRVFTQSNLSISIQKLSDGRYLDVNDAFHELTGFSPEEAIGKSPADLGLIVDQARVDQFSDVLRRIGAVKDWPATTRHKNGSVSNVLISATTIKLGEEPCAIILTRDVTQSVRAMRELTLKASQQATVVALGRRFLTESSIPVLLNDTARVVAETLKVPYCSVLECHNDGVAAHPAASYGAFLDHDAESLAELQLLVRSQSESVMRAGLPVVHEDLVQKPDLAGPSTPVRAYAGVLIGAPSRPYGVLSVCSDLARQFSADDLNFLAAISNSAAEAIERSRAEDDLRGREIYYRSLIENSSDVIDVLDIQGNILFEAGATHLFGLNPSEVTGTHMTDWAHPDDVAAVNQAFQACFRSPETVRRIECRFKRADGSWADCEVVGRTMSGGDGNPVLVTSTRDITERKRADEERGLLASIVDSSYDAVYSVDLTGKVTSWNPGAERLFGYVADEIVGIDFGVAIPPNHREQARDALAQVARGLGQNFESERVRKDGSIAEVAITIFPIRDSNGVIVRAGVIARDVTDRNKAVRDLADARDQALESSRLKTAFLSNMSHEIRTPLNVIMGFGEIIAGHMAAVGDRSKDEEIEAIRRNGRRLMDTIQGILDFSKIEVGAFELHPKPIRLSGMVASQVRDLNVLAARKGLVLSARIDQAPSVWFDEYCLAGALTNLIQNAIKFTDSGEVCVRLYRDTAGFPCIDISDTGIGIRSAYMNRLFEPFTQASSGYTRRFEGSGLGLALTRKYLEMNGASLSVSSQAGKGSRFTVTFSRESDTGIPVDDLGQALAAQPEKRASTPAPFASIMLVEDDPDTVRYMTSILSKRYRVLTAASGDEIRKELASGCPDLILMDLTLRGDEDGLMVTRDLKKHAEWKHVPIIAVTAYARTEDREAALAAGCDDYLTKPVLEAALIQKIQGLLSNVES